MSKPRGLVVFKQLIREFWIPLFVAIIWCVYNFSGPTVSSFRFTLLLNCFVGAFFFVSWLLSQYFRVRKQTKVDTDLKSIHENVSSV